MLMDVNKRLQEFKVILPEVQSVGNYLPTQRVDKLIYVSGQLPKVEGRIAFKGRIGRETRLETGQKAARACIANCLAAVQAEIGDLNKIKRIIHIRGYVASAIGFTDHHKVIDAASNLLVDIFGEAGKHARAAVGVVDLPMGAPVEIEMIVEIK
jgi:enamine deaminase RidA (YjgF/YER057c/UK114 family)